MDDAGFDDVRNRLILEPLVLCQPIHPGGKSAPWQRLEEACGSFAGLSALPFGFTFKDMSEEDIVLRGGLPPFDFA